VKSRVDLLVPWRKVAEVRSWDRARRTKTQFPLTFGGFEQEVT
jgi:hypothetical protein